MKTLSKASPLTHRIVEHVVSANLKFSCQRSGLLDAPELIRVMEEIDYLRESGSPPASGNGNPFCSRGAYLSH